MLIFSRARLFSASWRAAFAGAALTLPLVTLAYADMLYVGGCVGAPGTASSRAANRPRRRSVCQDSAAT